MVVPPPPRQPDQKLMKRIIWVVPQQFHLKTCRNERPNWAFLNPSQWLSHTQEKESLKHGQTLPHTRSVRPCEECACFGAAQWIKIKCGSRHEKSCFDSSARPSFCISVRLRKTRWTITAARWSKQRFCCQNVILRGKCGTDCPPLHHYACWKGQKAGSKLCK